MTAKYKTFRELKQAFDIGELGPDDIMTLDNDSVSMSKWHEQTEEDEDIYDSDPFSLLTDALDFLGIPWDNA